LPLSFLSSMAPGRRSPPGPMGTALNLPHRAPELPPLHKLSSHPEVPADATGNIYLWLQDRSKEAFEATLRNSANFVVPKSHLEIQRRGLSLFNVCLFAVSIQFRSSTFQTGRLSCRPRYCLWRRLFRGQGSCLARRPVCHPIHLFIQSVLIGTPAIS
jgi:hypothetical protein